MRMQILNVGRTLLHGRSATHLPIVNTAVAIAPLVNRLRARVCATLVAALVAMVLTGSASAATISYVSISGFWHDPVDNVPGVQPGDPVITNGTPTSSISWGVTSGSQSGYDFTGTIPPPLTLPGPVPYFRLGHLRIGISRSRRLP